MVEHKTSRPPVVILNLFQDDERRLVILKQVQDDGKGGLREKVSGIATIASLPRKALTLPPSLLVAPLFGGATAPPATVRDSW